MKCMQKFAGLAVLGVAGVCGSAGATWLMQSEPVQAQEGDKDVLTAREFHLVDDKGVPRMMFDIGDDGSARITMMDANLKPRLQLGVDGEQASCAFLDDKGTPRYVVAHRNKDNNVLITFADAKGTPRLLQSLTDDGDAVLAIQNAKQEKLITLMGGDESPTALLLADGKGTSDLSLFAQADMASIQLNATKHKSNALMACLGDGRPLLALTHKEKLRLRGMTAEDGTPELILLNEKKEATWRAGK